MDSLRGLGDQVLRSRAMSWVNGKIYIVELPTWVHDNAQVFFRELMRGATPTGIQFLSPADATYVEALDHIEPDLSFRPAPASGAALPQGLQWGEFHTLKVEVGVSQRWPRLNNKTAQWARFPGVQYVLCIHISCGLNARNYRLFSVANGAIEQPEMAITPIVDPTPVSFNSRRLLGLPQNAQLPPGFPGPDVVVDLWPVVTQLIAISPNPAAVRL